MDAKNGILIQILAHLCRNEVSGSNRLYLRLAQNLPLIGGGGCFMKCRFVIAIVTFWSIGAWAQFNCANVVSPVQSSARVGSLAKDHLLFLKLALEAEQVNAKPEVRSVYARELKSKLTAALREIVADSTDLLDFKLLKASRLQKVEKQGISSYSNISLIKDLSTGKEFNILLTVRPGEQNIKAQFLFDRMEFIKDQGRYLEFSQGSAIDRKTGLVTPHHLPGFLARQSVIQSAQPSTLDRLAWSMKMKKELNSTIKQLFSFYFAATVESRRKPEFSESDFLLTLDYLNLLASRGTSNVPAQILIGGLSIKTKKQFVEAIKNEISKPSLDQDRAELTELLSEYSKLVSESLVDKSAKAEAEDLVESLKRIQSGIISGGVLPSIRTAINSTMGLKDFEHNLSSDYELGRKGDQLIEKIVHGLLEPKNPVFNADGAINFTL
jgi:hypothetical protein